MKISVRKAAVSLYAAALVLWLGGSLFHMGLDATRKTQSIPLESLQMQDIQPAGDNTFITTSGDAQILIENIDSRARLVLLQAEFSQKPMEMELYYTRKPQQGFSPRHRVTGQPLPDGSYLYRLPAGHIQSLRLDPGTASDNQFVLEAILINPSMPAGFYLRPTLRTVMGLLLWPALALCAIYTIIEYDFALRVFRKKKKRKAVHHEP